MLNMKKLEDYWVIGNVKGGRRKYNTKAEAIASLDGKIPTYDHKKFKLEHHMVTLEEVEPTVELPKGEYSYNEIKDIVDKIRGLLLDGKNYTKEKGLFTYDYIILCNKDVQDMIGVDINTITAKNMCNYKATDDTRRMLIEGVLSEGFLSSVSKIKLISTNCDLKECNGATIIIETKWMDEANRNPKAWSEFIDETIKNKEPLPILSLTIQVRPEDIVFHNSMIYGWHVNVRSWEYMSVEGFASLVDKNIKSIKKKHSID
jgi:hypothetical protein